MHPRVELDRGILANNARAWIAFSGVPLLAVVKCAGYGWGFAPLVDALEPIAQAFCVADDDELTALRRWTAKPAILLAGVPLERLRRVLDLDAMPTIGTPAELELVREWARERSRPLRVRVGVRSAAGWTGLSLDELRAFAPRLAQSAAQTYLWTHLTDAAALDEQQAAFARAVAVARAGGVHVAGTDLSSTLPLAAGSAAGSAIRIGAGLFGATGGRRVDGVACAISVSAPVLRIERHAAGSRVGYGGTMLGMEQSLAIARGGYGDGLPAGLEPAGAVMSMGMQYLTVSGDAVRGDSVVLLDRHSDLDAFANSAGRSVHELVTALGNAVRASRSEIGADAVET